MRSDLPSRRRPKGRYVPSAPPLVSNVRRHMRARVVASSIAVAFSCAAIAADAPASPPEALYSMSAQTMPGKNGELLSMTIREVKREAEFSIADIEATSEAGRSSAASLFLVRGLCGLMLARGHKLAVAEQVSEQPIEFKMTFPVSAAVDERRGLPRMVLSETTCAPFQERRE